MSPLPVALAAAAGLLSASAAQVTPHPLAIDAVTEQVERSVDRPRLDQVL